MVLPLLLAPFHLLQGPVHPAELWWLLCIPAWIPSFSKPLLYARLQAGCWCQGHSGLREWGQGEQTSQRTCQQEVASAPTGFNPGRLPTGGDLQVGPGSCKYHVARARVCGGWGGGQWEERQGLGRPGLRVAVPCAKTQPEVTHLKTPLTAAKEPQC